MLTKCFKTGDDNGAAADDLLFLQIYIFYGTRSNAEFVIHNGFFFQDNAHDRVKIKLGVSKSERLYAMKAEVLARAGIPAYVQPFSLFRRTNLPPLFFLLIYKHSVCKLGLMHFSLKPLIWVKESFRLTFHIAGVHFCLPTVDISTN